MPLDTRSLPAASPGVADSPILAMAQRAAELRAAGRDIVDLTLGEPDFCAPDHVLDAARAAVGLRLPYTPSAGTPRLRAAIGAAARRDHGLDYADDEIVVGCGAKQVIFSALLATLRPGDEVIVPAPYWPSYPEMVRLCGGTPVIVGTRGEDGFRLHPGALEAAVTERTRWLLLNAPGNPTGAVAGREALGEIADVLRRHRSVSVLSDEIYAGITYLPEPPCGIVAVAPDLRDRVLVVNGVSKVYAMTGWRVGWGLGPRHLVASIAAVHAQSTTQTATISQIAAVAALEGPQSVVADRREVYRQRRDLAVEVLCRSPRVRVAAPDGAFYLLPQILGGDDVEIAGRLLDAAGVATVPGSAFGAPGHLRLSFATDLVSLRRGCELIVAELGETAR